MRRDHSKKTITTAAIAAALAGVLLHAGAASAQTTSLAAVHWHSGQCFQAAAGAPAGSAAGWNIETVIGSNDAGWLNASLNGARNAKAVGLRNIVRVDYRGHLAVPMYQSEYSGWATEFWNVVNQFKSQGLADIFIVGNEPNIENCVGADQYVSAFNYLYAHGNKPAGIQLLAAGPATYSPNRTFQNGACANIGGTFLDWLQAMARDLAAVDGFAIHTYGGYYDTDQPLKCPSNPSQPCTRNTNWAFDAGFQSYKQQIARINTAGKTTQPIYITEFNTDVAPGTMPDPATGYLTDWINNAFSDVRAYNAANGNRVKSLAWFVDRNEGGGWANFSLTNIPSACTDMKQEFANLANYPGGGGTCGATVASTRWKGEYFNNTTLSGSPAMVRDDGAGTLNFNWGTGAPGGCGTTVDNFSVRWTRTVSLTGGTWRFTTTTDDGVRLYVDGVLRIDRWVDQGPTTLTADVALGAGNHTIVMHYYERGGGAVAQLSWAAVGGPQMSTQRLDVRYPMAAGLWITECLPDGSGRYVWQTTSTGKDVNSRWANFMWPEGVNTGCGTLSNGLYPLVFTSLPAGTYPGTWVTQCLASGKMQHVYRIDTTVNNSPAAVYLYDEPNAACP